MSEIILEKETATGGFLTLENMPLNTPNGSFVYAPFVVGIKWADGVFEWMEEFETLPLALMRFALLLELEETEGTFTDNADTFSRYAQAFMSQMGEK